MPIETNPVINQKVPQRTESLTTLKQPIVTTNSTVPNPWPHHNRCNFVMIGIGMMSMTMTMTLAMALTMALTMAMALTVAMTTCMTMVA